MQQKTASGRLLFTSLRFPKCTHYNPFFHRFQLSSTVCTNGNSLKIFFPSTTPKTAQKTKLEFRIIYHKSGSECAKLSHCVRPSNEASTIEMSQTECVTQLVHGMPVRALVVPLHLNSRARTMTLLITARKSSRPFIQRAVLA